MSVRICYLRRASQGASLTSLRLVGHSSDERWPEGATPTGAARDFVDAAAWIKQRLAGTRSTSSLAMLCLDVEGGVCSWLTSPSSSPTIVAALARQAGSPMGVEGDAPARAGASAVDFYAGDAFSSSIQALAAPSTAPSRNGTHNNSDARIPQDRMAVLAVSDVPARLLVDALDAVGVPVDAVASLWHVMGTAWDPGATRPQAEPDPLVAESTSLTGVVLIDPESGRLLWAWSQAGQLMVAGSMRIRRGAAESASLALPGADQAPQESVLFGPDEVSRLAAEWLTWAAQVGHAPSRFICVLPEGSQAQAAAFGQALGRAWPGATVDLALHENPVGATLSRCVTVLDNTPLKAQEPDPRLELVDLSTRPGKQHRRMYLWWSIAVAACAIAVVAAGIQLRSSATRARAAADQWNDYGRAAIKEVDPEAMIPRAGTSPYAALAADLERVEKANKPAERTDQTMPLLDELETISMVVGTSGLALESIDLDSKGFPRFTAIAPDTRSAEDLWDAIQRISDPYVSGWTASYATKREGETDKVRGTYSGHWVLQPKPAGGAR